MEAPSCLAARRMGGQWARTLVVFSRSPKISRSRAKTSFRMGSPWSSSISRTLGTGPSWGIGGGSIRGARARHIISAAINDDRREGGEHVAKGRNMQKEKKKPKKAKK